MQQSDRQSLEVRPIRVAVVLASISSLLILFAVVGQHFRWQGSEHHLIGVFDLDSEKNPPALFASFLLVAASVSLGLVAASEAGSRWARHWVALALGFLVMAIDEAFSFHEKLIEPVRGWLGDDYPLVFHFAWVVPGLIVVGLVALTFVGFLRALPGRTRTRYLLAAALYLGGAVGMEMVGGRYFALHGSDFTQSMIAITEESLEMFGATYFVHATLMYLAERRNTLRLHFRC